MQFQPVPFPTVEDFAKLPVPTDVLPVVWKDKFLKAVEYRDFRVRQWKKTPPGKFKSFLQHEIKRAEIDIGLWLGRMKETGA